MSYLEDALRKEGLSTGGSKKEKLERLEQCHQRRSPGKQPMKLSRKDTTPDVASAKLTSVEFFEQNRPEVSKKFKKSKEIAKELKRMYKQYEDEHKKHADKKSTDTYEVLDEKLDDTFASNRGLRCLNPSGPGPYYYKKESTSDTTSPTKRKGTSTKKVEKDYHADEEEDDEDDEDEQNLEIDHSLLVNFFKQRSIHNNTLKLLAQECGKAISGKKEVLAGRIADSIISFKSSNDEGDDEEEEEEEEGDDDNDDEDEDDDEEDDDDEEEEDED